MPLSTRRTLLGVGAAALLLLTWLQVDGLDRMRGVVSGGILAPWLSAEELRACRIVTRAPISGEGVITEDRGGLTWFVAPVDERGRFRFVIDGDRTKIPIACIGADTISPDDVRISPGWSLPLVLRRLYWCRVELVDEATGEPARTRFRESGRVTAHRAQLEFGSLSASDLAMDYLDVPDLGLTFQEGSVSFACTRDLDDPPQVELGLDLQIAGFHDAEWQATVPPGTGDPYVDQVPLQRRMPSRLCTVPVTRGEDLSEFADFEQRSVVRVDLLPKRSSEPTFVAHEVLMRGGEPLTFELPEEADYRMLVRFRRGIPEPGGWGRQAAVADVELPLRAAQPAQPSVVNLDGVSLLAIPQQPGRAGEHGFLMLLSGPGTQPYDCRFAAERGLLLDGLVSGRHDMYLKIGEDVLLGSDDLEAPFVPVEVSPGVNTFPFE